MIQPTKESKVIKKDRGKEKIRKDPDLLNWQIAEQIGVGRDTVRRWSDEVREEERKKQRDTEVGFTNRHKTMNVRF